MQMDKEARGSTDLESLNSNCYKLQSLEHILHCRLCQL